MALGGIEPPLFGLSVQRLFPNSKSRAYSLSARVKVRATHLTS